MSTGLKLPQLYPILDWGTVEALGLRLRCVAAEMARAGMMLVQYRDKQGSPKDILRRAAMIAEAFEGTGCQLVMNDRADLAKLADWHAVHVGHKDLPPEAARAVLGADSMVGVSTHGDEQVRLAERADCDYIAIGPVFRTSSKADAETVIGLEGLRRARTLTRKPLVAIGGIDRFNARAVVEAGADSVAVIGGIFSANERPGKVIRDFLAVLR